MKEVKNNKFEFNGVIEKVLKSPISRTDFVTITIGGREEFSETIPLEHFEQHTNYYFNGLEPLATFNENDEIEKFKSNLIKQDFNIDSDTDYSILSAEIKYATVNNSIMNCYVILKKNNDQYCISVGKNQSYMRKGEKTFSGKNLPLLIESASEQVKKYTSTKLQILSKKIKQDENTREQDKNGIKKLFDNETLSDYFKKQDMPAGVVINAKNRYQIFTSYLTASGIRSLHYVTKDYANLKNAEKALNSNGYTHEGKQLDCLNIDEITNNLESQLSQRYGGCWSDDLLSEFHTDAGLISISNIYKEDSNKFGVGYYTDIIYTDEKTGQYKTKNIPIEIFNGEYNSYQVFCKITELVSDMENKNKNGILDFDKDERTLKEKIDFHLERRKSIGESLKHFKKYVEERTQPEKRENILIDFKTRMEDHLKMAKTIDKESQNLIKNKEEIAELKF